MKIKTVIEKIALIALLISLSACFSTPKGDADRYKDMRGSTIFKTYQKLSIKALKPVVKKYNKKLASQNKAQIGDIYVHALLSLIWIASAQPKLALAEAEYALSQAKDPRDRYAALTIKSLALHEKGWHFLAKQHSVEAKLLLDQQGLSNRYNNVLLLAHVGGTLLALKNNEIPMS